MTRFATNGGLGSDHSAAPCGTEGSAVPAVGSDAKVSDLYHSQADVIADELLADPDFFEPVNDDFAANSDEGYGQWSADGDGVNSSDHGEFEAAGESQEGFDRRARDLTDDERSALDELGRVMSGAPDSALLSNSGRGAYVHRDDASDDAASVADHPPAAGPALDAALADDSQPWWRFRWFDHHRLTHRVGACVAGAVVVMVVVAVVSSLVGTDAPSTPAAPNPAFTVPTVFASTPPPPGPAPGTGADGPIGVRHVDSRCTAGSTDPMQAFDNDAGTAWMCLPAYGVPGTVLRVEFDNWYVITGLSIVPGWNRVNPDGSDEWLKHMTAAVVEYQFNDPSETRLTQVTNGVRDEVATLVQPSVLASAMTITVREFGTPTGQVADTTTIPGKGGIIVSDRPKTGDLKDFAISSISIIGHHAT